MVYLLAGLIWLSVTSLAVTIGRAIQSPVIAYPVAALASFLLLALIFMLVTAVSSLGLLGQLQDVQDILGQE